MTLRTDVPAPPISLRHPFAERSLRWLVGLPVVLVVLTLALFGMYALQPDPGWARGAFVANVLAVLAAVLAVLFGTSDFRHIPLHHPARQLGPLHALLNGTSLFLLVSSLVAHDELASSALGGRSDRLATVAPVLALAALTVLIVGATAISGAIGLRMVHRYRVGDVERGRTYGG